MPSIYRGFQYNISLNTSELMILLPYLKLTLMRFLTHTLVLSMCLCVFAKADDVPPVVLTVAASLLPDAEPDRVEPAPVAGFYQAIYGTRAVYPASYTHLNSPTNASVVAARVHTSHNSTDQTHSR